MIHCDLSQIEQKRRREIALNTRKMIVSQFHIDSQDETSLMTDYRDYYRYNANKRVKHASQACFSRTHA